MPDPNHPVPCIRFDENGNNLPCPHGEFTVTYEAHPSKENCHFQRMQCDLCPLIRLNAMMGPCPVEE